MSTGSDPCAGSKTTPAAWKRVEPWMITFVDLANGEVLDVVDGRDSAAVAGWLAAQPRWWRRRVQVVAIDPSAAFRSAVRRWLPKARVSVDHFHLVKLGNDMLTGVRRRVSWDLHGRRGRGTDLAWAHRLLLLRGYDTLSERGRARLDEVLANDDPTTRSAPRGASRNNCGSCSRPPRSRRRRGAGQVRPVRHLGADARDHQAEEDRRRLVERDRDLHRDPRHQRQDRGRERDDQEHQADREGVPVTGQLPIQDHALQRRPKRGMNTRITSKVEEPANRLRRVGY